MSLQRKHHNSHVATIFCNRLAKLLQKIVASQKNQHIHHMMGALLAHEMASLAFPNLRVESIDLPKVTLSGSGRERMRRLICIAFTALSRYTELT